MTNGFVQAILPDTPPTDPQRTALLTSLALDPLDIRCVYCGDTATDWDHLRPLVRGKRPTGYLTDHRNLVPACGRCNQSKGGQYWRDWMSGPAVNSPQSRGIADLSERIERLSSYENGTVVDPIDFSAVAGPDLWNSYWEKLAIIEGLMKEAQCDAEIIRARLSSALCEQEPLSDRA